MRPAHYSAAEQIESDRHPAQRPAFSLKNRMMRALWGITSAVFFRLSPRPLHAWRAFLLRCFGATLGRASHIYPKAKIWAPWNLHCSDYVAIADGADIYNPAPMYFGEFAIVSQDSYVCGATHDYDDPDFPLLAFEMHIGTRAWICARACVAPGVRVGDGAVLALASVATRDLDPWSIYAGAPAKKVKERAQTILQVPSR